MSAVQIVNSTWFMPGWIGMMLGIGIGFTVVMVTQWAMGR